MHYAGSTHPCPNRGFQLSFPTHRIAICLSHPVLTRYENPKPSWSLTESEFVEMDDRSWQRIFVAGGLWCIQRQLIQHGFVDSIHQESGKASSEISFRRGVPRHSPEARPGTGCTTFARLEGAAPRKAPYFFLSSSARRAISSARYSSSERS